MNLNRDESSAKVSGPDTGPLPPQGESPSYGGQPTTYVPPQVPPEIRPQGTYGGNYGSETPSAHAATTPPVPSYPSYGLTQPEAPTPAVHQERRPHRTPILGPLLLICAGVLFLLNNMGVLPWSVWETLGRLWPLILIAIGLDLIIGRRNPFVSVLLVLAVLAAGGAFDYYNGGFATSGDFTRAPLLVPLNNARSADVRVDLGVGNLSLGSLEGDTGALATGTLEYLVNRGAPRQGVSENGNIAKVEISESSEGWNFGWFGGRSPSWEINLNERVPMDLHVDSGTGNTTLALERLQLTSLTVDAGTGNASITLPSQAKDISVEIDGGTGNLEVFVPDKVEAHIEIDSGIGNTNVDSRFSKRGEDTYESSGYATATNKVTIKINHGVGNVNVRSK